MNRVVGDLPIEAFRDEAPEPAAKPPEARPRVLLVDDDERNLLALATVLEDLGEVVLARSGDEALRQLLKGEFAVILLDVYMPGMDGYETAQIIRSRDQSKGIPIVFLSAVNKEAEHLLRGYSMGAVDYVFKPVDPVVLRSKVAVFVDLFAKTKEIERKAEVQQALLEANLKANAERLNAERELRFAEQRQAAILQALPIVLYVEQPGEGARAPQYVAGNFAALTGFSADEVANNPNIFLDRLHPDDKEKVQNALSERAATGAMSVEYRWLHADGTYRHFLDQTVQLPDEGKGVGRLAGTFLDVTDRKSLENQLIQAQKMDAIGKLTGGIAHDFNNLLAAVIGGVGLLEKRAALQDDERKILGMTKRAAEQGSELVRRLLAFARRQKLEPQTIDIESLREAVSDLLTHTLGGLTQIEWKVEQGVWNAFADQAQLELALVNLIINARDAMPNGGTVTVSVENRPVKSGARRELSSDHVLIAVTDTGTGITPDNLERVMDPFFTTKDVGKGSGLGLSMVYGFAQQSNGAFYIHSEVGRGTRAELCLPRAPSEQNVEPLQAAESAPPSSTRPLKILLVDDHEEVRATTGAMLEEFGHTVVGTANGKEALQILQNGDADYDLMISDYAMPHVSGTEFLRAAREICEDVPALIITGYAEIESISNRPENVEVLLKPFTPSALEAAIGRLCA